MTDIQPFQQGAESADDPDDQKDALAEERACTKRWLEKIKQARDFDKAIRTQYARNRKYARGDDGKFEVSVPIASANIDVLRSFLFAKNPDVAVEPSASTNPPPEKDLLAKARADAEQQQQQTQQAAATQLAPFVHEAAASGALQGLLPAAMQAMQAAPQQDPADALDSQAQDTAQKQIAPYQQLRQDAKQFAQTLELVIAQLWKQADLKKQGLPLVGSALSIGVGWLKASWQERTGDDPIMRNELNDLQDNLARLAQTQDEIAEGEAQDIEAQKADLQQQILGIQAKIEVVVARGLAIDFETGENIQLATECGPYQNYLQSPWIAHRTFLPMADAKASFKALGDTLGKAQVYFPRKPRDANDSTNGNDVGSQSNVDAKDADAYTTYSDGTGVAENGSVCVWEVWNKDDNTVLTLIEGVDRYAKPVYAPDPGTTRFYPFFLYPIGTVDGERHPVSLITRSEKLFDEYNRARSNWRTARFRAIPKLAFDKAELDDGEATNIQNGTTQEWVGVTLTSPDKKLSDIVVPIAYNKIDEALYDTAPILHELEKVWGVQEALTQGVSVAKTATEAEIQQTGTNSRTAYMRDGLDDLLSDLANYTAQVALQKMTHEDVVRIAGPYAFWPQGIRIEDLSTLVEVSIRAGSAGKPNTSLRQQTWATVMPLVKDSIVQIGQLRGSPPEEVADKLGELMIETLARTGERIDVERFLPEPPAKKEQKPSAPPPNPSDTAMQGQQIDAMLKTCDQVRTGQISGQTAIAILTACFPTVPVQQIESMVAGIAKVAPALPPDHPGRKQTNGNGKPMNGEMPDMTPAEHAQHMQQMPGGMQ